MFGALILKALLGLPDDGLLDNLILDTGYQYALQTTSCIGYPVVSDKTLQKFRRRCCEYKTEMGIDLIHGCVAAFSSEVAKAMGTTGKVKRMDSMMIEAPFRRLSCMELLYQCAR